MFFVETSYIFKGNTVYFYLKHRMFSEKTRDVFVKNIPCLWRKYRTSSAKQMSILRPTSTILLAQSRSLQRNNRFNRQFCCLRNLLNRKQPHCKKVLCGGDGFDFSGVWLEFAQANSLSSPTASDAFFEGNVVYIPLRLASLKINAS